MNELGISPGAVECGIKYLVHEYLARSCIVLEVLCLRGCSDMPPRRWLLRAACMSTYAQLQQPHPKIADVGIARVSCEAMATTLNRIINHKAAWHLVDARGQASCTSDW